MWRLEEDRGFCQAIGFSARVDLQRAEAGLFDLCVAGQQWSTSGGGRPRILQVHASPSVADGKMVLLERYVRAADLVATYRIAERRDVLLQIYWRVLESDESGSGIEVLISMQTDLHRSVSPLTVSSALPAREAWRLVDEDVRQDGPQWTEASVALGRTLETAPEDGAGLFLFRLAGELASYVAMVHPADFSAARLSAGNAAGDDVTLSFELFSEPLEKGVIRRGRVRGMFVPRGRDHENAMQRYRQLLLASPPLAT